MLGIIIALGGTSVIAWAEEAGHVPGGREAEMRERFEELYRKSRKALPSYSSTLTGIVADNPALEDIISLGPECLPQLMAKIREDDFKAPLLYVAYSILKIKMVEFGTDSECREHLEDRMKSGYEEAEKAFEKLRKELFAERRRAPTLELWRDIVELDPEFKVLTTRRERTRLGEVYHRIQALGTFALPFLLNEIEKGHSDFLPIVGFLTNMKAPVVGGRVEEVARNVLRWWKQHDSEWLLPKELRASGQFGDHDPE